jgi:hypothetical protein
LDLTVEMERRKAEEQLPLPEVQDVAGQIALWFVWHSPTNTEHRDRRRNNRSGPGGCLFLPEERTLNFLDCSQVCGAGNGSDSFERLPPGVLRLFVA